LTAREEPAMKGEEKARKARRAATITDGTSNTILAG
jgi:hypothetical protein